MKKYFLYFWAIFKARLLCRRVPILVTLCVTNRCNLRCAYCYEEYYDRNFREIPKEKMFSLIDDLARMGTRYISINGGEALLRSDLEEIVDKIRSHGMLVHLSTNGVLVPSRLSLLRKLDSIAVSLDGLEAENDLNRGKGSYTKIRAGLAALQEAGIKFHTHTVLTKHNKNALAQILPLAKEFGCQAQFSLLRVEDSPQAGLGLGAEELRVIVKKILDYKKKGYPVFFSRQAYENYLAWPLPDHEQVIWDKIPAGFKPIKCYIKRFACHIEANGYVYPCIVLVNKGKALNFLEVGFKKCWESLAENSCLACHNICCNDLNLVFGLNIFSLSNAARVVRERLRKK